MEFFQPPKPRPRAPFDPAVWSQPRPNSLGATVPWRLLVGESARARVLLQDVIAHATGVEMTLSIRVETDDAHGRIFHRMAEASTGLHDEFLRFGVELDDGRKLTNLDEREEEPTAWLSRRGGGGGDREFKWRYWLWPLPPSGTLTFVCEWPVFDIALTHTTVVADDAIKAAERARIVWS
jgi:hypothetical protein